MICVYSAFLFHPKSTIARWQRAMVLFGWNEKAWWVTQRAMALLFAITWRTIHQSNGKDLLGCYNYNRKYRLIKMKFSQNVNVRFTDVYFIHFHETLSIGRWCTTIESVLWPSSFKRIIITTIFTHRNNLYLASLQTQFDMDKNILEEISRIVKQTRLQKHIPKPFHKLALYGKASKVRTK